ncbi:hypothetical protein [Mucilaginibacter hurinus]|nr:hypothetical protein [Mucilaginibacter hurinus]
MILGFAEDKTNRLNVATAHNIAEMQETRRQSNKEIIIRFNLMVKNDEN